MTASVSRRAFIARSGALAGSLALSGSLIALSQRIAAGEPLDSAGYGSLINKGDLWLPPGFNYSVVSRSGDPMSNGDPTPTRFDGMAAFEGPGNTTILMRNHENKARNNATMLDEIDVHSPVRYDPNPPYNGGVTRLVVKDDRVLDDRAILAGTTHNCAGGATPWGTWITCEELFQTGPAPEAVRHGYIFEVGAYEDNPTAATPVVSAGRFEHEAVDWMDGILYETEDHPQASFYRFIPTEEPRVAGDLARGGRLQGLKIVGAFAQDTRLADSWPGGVGAAHPVEWVDVPTPDAAGNSATLGVRGQVQRLGAAIFARTEGCWGADHKVYFDCTTGGASSLEQNPNGFGQIFELDVRENTLRLIFESKDLNQLLRPDNLVGSPSGDILLCEDNVGASDVVPPNFIRGLTADGAIYPFARAETNPTEFCGACFDAKGHVLYVNQQGQRETPEQVGFPAVTYAIRGPWKRKGTPEPGTPTPTSTPEASTP
ncbi:MAG: alkaline phosphatase PhoX [Actinomycetota bacterium]